MDAAVPRTKVRPDFIPASDYISPEVHRLELERLWPRVWQIACREEEIPKVGDYVNYEIGEESILVVRASAKTIKALYNVCSHRGRRLRDDLSGNVQTFRCNYHAWCFDLEGKVTHIPSEEDWKSCPDFGADDLALKEVKVDTWAGFVWINMNPNCEPLREFLAPLPEKMDAFEIEKKRIHAYWTIIAPVNWKVVLEAFIEGYHTTGTHPQFLRFGKPSYPGAEEDFKASRKHATHTVHSVPPRDPKDPSKAMDARLLLCGVVQELHDTLGTSFLDASMAAMRRIMTEVPEGTPAADVHHKFFDFQKEETIKLGASWPSRLKPEDLWSTDWQIFPNTSALPGADGTLWYRMRPYGTDPNMCIFDIWGLGRFPPGKEPKVEREFFQGFESFKNRSPFLEQDFKNIVSVQKGMRSRGWRGARPSPIQETSVSNFHRVLHQYLYGEGA